MIKTKKPQSIQSKPKIKTSTVKGIKKQTIVLGKGGSKSKEVNKKKSISEVKKKESEGKDKKSQVKVKPEIIIKEIEKNMKQLKKYYYQSIQSNRNSSRQSQKPQTQYRSCRQSFELLENKKSKKSQNNKRKQSKPKKLEEKKSLFEIYNLYKHSIDSSMSRYNQKRPSTPHNSASSKKGKNSSTKIHGTSASMVSNKEQDQSNSYVTPFQISRPASALDTKNLIKEKVKKKKSEKKENDNVVIDFSKKDEIEEIRFDNIPQVHSSLFNQNMPIMEEDQKYEVSSCIGEITSEKKKKKCQTEQIQSLAGCSIPKIGQTDFEDFQLISIQL